MIVVMGIYPQCEECAQPAVYFVLIPYEEDAARAGLHGLQAIEEHDQEWGQAAAERYRLSRDPKLGQGHPGPFMGHAWHGRKVLGVFEEHAAGGLYADAELLPWAVDPLSLYSDGEIVPEILAAFRPAATVLVEGWTARFRKSERFVHGDHEKEKSRALVAELTTAWGLP
jgi:hypothetical protein